MGGSGDGGGPFRRAAAARAKARVAILGPAGAGKTLGALYLARGLAGPAGRIVVIDTERGRSEQYEGAPGVGGFDVAVLAPPFAPARYLEVLDAAYAAAYDVVVVDSLAHEWAGQGGTLEVVDVAQSRGGNKFTAWAGPSRAHAQFVERLVQAPTHLVATCRVKTAYEIVEERGQKIPRKIGLAPVQRDGLEYEFDVVLEVALDGHTAALAKANTAYADVLADALAAEPRITPALGARLRAWAGGGRAAARRAHPAAAAALAAEEAQEPEQDAPPAPAPAAPPPAAAPPRVAGAPLGGVAVPPPGPADVRPEVVAVSRDLDAVTAAVEEDEPAALPAADVRDVVAAALAPHAELAARVLAAPADRPVDRDLGNEINEILVRRTSRQRAAEAWTAVGWSRGGPRPTGAMILDLVGNHLPPAGGEVEGG